MLAKFFATEEARKSVEITLIGSVAIIYVSLLADDELLRVTRDTFETREDSFKLTKLKFDYGATSELDFRQAEQLLEAARAAFFPRIALTANAGTASTELSGLFKSGTFALTGAATLLQPIFDAGRNRANLEVTKVNRKIAVAQYEKANQIAFREVSDSLAGRATLTEQLRAQAAQTKAAQITYNFADLRYCNGAASYLEVLDAQRTLFAAQKGTVQAQALQIQNLFTLYKVLGGGWVVPTSGKMR